VEAGQEICLVLAAGIEKYVKTLENERHRCNILELNYFLLRLDNTKKETVCIFTRGSITMNGICVKDQNWHDSIRRPSDGIKDVYGVPWSTWMLSLDKLRGESAG